MNARELGLDYFATYNVADQMGGYVVGLQGQFDHQPETTRITRLTLFANRASKNGEPIYDENANLSWYHVYDPSPDPVRGVVIESQFGESKLILGRSFAFMSPTQLIDEEGGDPPEKLDHYKIYRVLRGAPVNKTVQIDSQLSSKEAEIAFPVFFGVPVRKWWNGHTSEIHNDKAHLAFYQTFWQIPWQTIRTRDQFSSRLLNVYTCIMLGVPCVKREWAVLEDRKG